MIVAHAVGVGRFTAWAFPKSQKDGGIISLHQHFLFFWLQIEAPGLSLQFNKNQSLILNPKSFLKIKDFDFFANWSKRAIGHNPVAANEGIETS